MRALVPALVLLTIPAISHADEPTPPPAASAPAPASSGSTFVPPGVTVVAPPGSAGVTVVAPPQSPGVTVVAPTAQGGTVTAQGCQSVTVQGQPAVIDPGAPCPYQPYQPPPPQIIYIERDPRPKFRPDHGRSAAIALGALTQGIGSLLTLSLYLKATDHYSCTYTSSPYSSHCDQSNAVPELLLYSGLMTLAPAIPRLVVGDGKGAAFFSLGIVASIAMGKVMDASDKKFSEPGAGFALFGFVGAAAIGIVELATTPHREDLEPKKSGPSIEGFSAAPLADARGTHGMTVGMLGSF